jgi:hypothetical protein
LFDLREVKTDVVKVVATIQHVLTLALINEIDIEEYMAINKEIINDHRRVITDEIILDKSKMDLVSK